MKRTHDVPRLPHLDQFLRGESARKAYSTVRNHGMALRRFGAWLANQDGATATTVSPLQLDEYGCDLASRFPADQANGHVSALRVYLRWLAEMGLRSDDPGRALHFAPAQPTTIQALTAQEVGLLLRFVASSARLRFGTVRTAYLLPFLCETGLRIGEALALTMPDLDLVRGRLMVRAPKTRSIRTVPISPALHDLLTAYLARRAEHLISHRLTDSGMLFCAEHGGAWARTSAEASCRTVARLAGLNRRCYPHLARKTWATLSLINGAPLPAVMAMGGWRRLSTVQRYVSMCSEQLAQVAAASSPLAHAEKMPQ